MLASLRGRSVVITGGSRGIGRGIARVFARAGARLTIAALEPQEIADAVREMQGLGAEARGVTCDVTDFEAVQAMIDGAQAAFGAIDVLCANAGIFPQVPLAAMAPEDWDRVQATNLRSLFFCVKAALPHFARQGRGRVVVTSSITGPITGYPGWAHYGASKAGQLGFVRTAALELARYGVTINAVLPGNILTEGLQALGEDYVAQMTRAVPLGRLGTVEDVGHAVAFLASDEASYITGQTLVIDGGQILPESPEALALTRAEAGSNA